MSFSPHRYIFLDNLILWQDEFKKHKVFSVWIKMAVFCRGVSKLLMCLCLCGKRSKEYIQEIYFQNKLWHKVKQNKLIKIPAFVSSILAQPTCSILYAHHPQMNDYEIAVIQVYILWAMWDCEKNINFHKTPFTSTNEVLLVNPVNLYSSSWSPSIQSPTWISKR